MQTYQNFASDQSVMADNGSKEGAQNMASFVARLMSLNSNEIQCLYSDTELMRHLSETQLLMESRLQHLSFQNKLAALSQQHQQYTQHLHQQHHHLHQQTYYQFYSPALQYNLLAAGPQPEHQVQFPNPHLSALDLRTTTPCGQFGYASSSSAASSPVGAQEQAVGQQQQTRAFNPKKLKLSEYQRELQDQTQQKLNQEQGNQLAAATTQQLTDYKPTQITTTTTTTSQAKKYKGEFDEPTPEQVEQRQRELANPENYHKTQDCACILGSQFIDKSASSVLEMVDRWRQLATEERIKAKWDVLDLPKDIPLSDIKKFEELRRGASRGRADFGGASKRKPLGIRGTRQFLLILYCLWGHPGREDEMQKQGYCPHCFAKIKKANEQSTLVRVVNHFNMKHRKGANPRLSPNRDTLTANKQQAAAAGLREQPALGSLPAQQDQKTKHRKQAASKCISSPCYSSYSSHSPTSTSSPPP